MGWVAFALRAWWDSTHERVWESVCHDPDVSAGNVTAIGVLFALLAVVIAQHRGKVARDHLAASIRAAADRKRMEKADELLAECRRLRESVGVRREDTTTKETRHGDLH